MKAAVPRARRPESGSLASAEDDAVFVVGVMEAISRELQMKRQPGLSLSKWCDMAEANRYSHSSAAHDAAGRKKAASDRRRDVLRAQPGFRNLSILGVVIDKTIRHRDRAKDQPAIHQPIPC